MNMPPYPMFLQVERVCSHEKALVSLWDVVWVQEDGTGCTICLRGGETYWVYQDFKTVCERIRDLLAGPE